MKKIPVILALVALALVAYSMTNWTKSGKTIIASKSFSTETRKVKDFEKIEVDGIFEVDVTYGSKESVEVEAPKNLLSSINLNVKSGTLVIEMDDNKSYKTQGGIKIHITTAKLYGFEISGASSVKLNNTLKDDQFSLSSSGAANFGGKVDVENAEIELDGASSVNLSGSAASANLTLSGASQLEDYDFEIKNATVDLSGASAAQITSLNSLKGEVSGASSLEYKGSPKVKSVSVSGAASLDRR